VVPDEAPPDDPRGAALREASAGTRWWYAAKVGSWPKLLVPALLGQAIGLYASPMPSLTAALVGLGFTCLAALYVVFLNDVADAEVDRLKRHMDPTACSPKTIPDGILPAASLLRAGALAGVLAMLVLTVGAVVLVRPVLPWLGLAGLLCFAAYSLPPLRLNYRGGGELLEAVGVGLLLPWLNAHAQNPWTWSPGLVLLAPIVAFAAASALASGLSDEASDRLGGKTTFTTLLGNDFVRASIERLVAGGCVAIAMLFRFAPGLPPRLWVAPVLVVGVSGWRTMAEVSRHATSGALEGQRVYKERLHQTLWGTMLALALVFVVAWSGGLGA
jgi:1,4-dihydroxy-2-naphthoate octaprenyltransferase/chlorophyll synthase